jgi:hypothetical protein
MLIYNGPSTREDVNPVPYTFFNFLPVSKCILALLTLRDRHAVFINLGLDRKLLIAPCLLLAMECSGFS